MHRIKNGAISKLKGEKGFYTLKNCDPRSLIRNIYVDCFIDECNNSIIFLISKLLIFSLIRVVH